MKCFDKFTENELKSILDRNSNFQTKNEQDLHLQSLIDVYSVRKRRSRFKSPTPTDGGQANEESSRPSHSVQHTRSYKFHVMVGEERKQVCKQAFLSINAVGEKRIRRLQGNASRGENPVDRRGQQTNRKTFPLEFVETVKDHIRSFPLKVSHYASKEIKYLDARLDIKKMHTIFLEANPGSEVKYSFYYKVYKEHFNYRFGRPQIDTCCECERLNNRIKNPQLNETAKRVAQAQMEVHKRRSNKFYKSIRDVTEYCKLHDNAMILCFDYMQNVSLPKIPVQETYYLRQLSVFPFGVHDNKNDKATFYLYHEGIAQKGANEVCSFLMKYINDNIPPHVDELYLYSDNCTGQNKNHTMIRFLMSLTETGRFKKVLFRLPIRGHSYLSCDRDFGMIKKKMNKIDRYYSTKEVMEIFLTATQQGKFYVDLIGTQDIVDFAKWWPLVYKKTTSSEETKVQKRGKKEFFQVSAYHQFKFESSQVGVVVTNEYIDGLNEKTFKLKTFPNEIAQIPTTKAYTGKRPIKGEKIEDLKKLMQYVPEEHKDFYSGLLQWPTK